MTLAGLLGVCAGLYGLLDAQSPVALGLPLLLAGSAPAAVGLWLGGRRATRSRYRPDPWGVPEWLVGACGVAAAATAVVAPVVSPDAMNPSTSPLVIPALPLLAGGRAAGRRAAGLAGPARPDDLGGAA